VEEPFLLYLPIAAPVVGPPAQELPAAALPAADLPVAAHRAADRQALALPTVALQVVAPQAADRRALALPAVALPVAARRAADRRALELPSSGASGSGTSSSGSSGSSSSVTGPSEFTFGGYTWETHGGSAPPVGNANGNVGTFDPMNVSVGSELVLSLTQTQSGSQILSSGAEIMTKQSFSYGTFEYTPAWSTFFPVRS
jgi:hypothetical protein